MPDKKVKAFGLKDKEVEEFFTEVVDKYQDKIYNLVYRILGQEEEAADLVQEAFINAYVHRQKFNVRRASFSTWLTRIAVNLAINRLRKRRRLKISSIEEHNNRALMISEDANLERLFEKDLVKIALDELEEIYKVVVVLRYVEELSLEEISKVLRIPVGTVKMRLFRAKDKLYERLKDYV